MQGSVVPMVDEVADTEADDPSVAHVWALAEAKREQQISKVCKIIEFELKVEGMSDLVNRACR
jgi:hypothetical protein